MNECMAVSRTVRFSSVNRRTQIRRSHDLVGYRENDEAFDEATSDLGQWHFLVLPSGSRQDGTRLSQ